MLYEGKIKTGVMFHRIVGGCRTIKNESGRISFRIMLMLTFFAVGILPLAASITLNLPHVLNLMGVSAEREALSDLKESYYLINREVDKLYEDLRLLSNIAGLRDFADSKDKGGLPEQLVKKRLQGVINRWFSGHKEVRSINLFSLDGVEILRFVSKEGRFSEDIPGEGSVNELFFKEIKKVNLKRPDKMITFVQNLITFNNKEHCHNPLVIIACPVHNYSGKIAAFAAISLDLFEMLHKFEHNYIVTGSGDCILCGRPRMNDHSHVTGKAFGMFPGLKELFIKKEPAVISLEDGRKTAWLPLIINSQPEHSLWIGRLVDFTNMTTIKKSFLARFLLVVLTLLGFVVSASIFLSSIADRYRRELVDILRSVFLKEKDTAVRLEWGGTSELRELGEDINRLVEQYLETEQMRVDALNKLSELSKRMKLILDNAAEGIIELDKKGTVMFVNPSACQMFGFARDDLVENDLHSILHYMREDRSQYPEEDCPFCNALKDNNLYISREDVFWNKNSEPVHVEYMTSPIREEGGDVKGMVMCIRDVTARKKAEERAEEFRRQLMHSQKVEAVGTLASGVAHDFNNLLTVIMGYTELIMIEFKDNEAALNFLNIIHDTVKNASSLTRQLLTFSRKQVAEKRIVDIKRLITDQKKMLDRLIGENIILETVFLDEQPLLNADVDMMGQVIMNLVLNARDAMSGMTGSIIITVNRHEIVASDEKMYKGGSSGRFVMISVADTGTGIEEKDLQRIFEPFFTTKTEGKGTGLGLALVYGIVEQHGGWINCYSEVGKGTVFKIYLPEYFPKEQEREETSVNSSGYENIGEGKTVFLIEDDEMLLNVSSEMLKSFGFQVVTSKDIDGALSMLKEIKYGVDIVISDVVLPDGSGFFIVEHLRENRPDIPVILVSGYMDERHHGEKIREQEVPFLAKPFSRDELAGMISKLIGGKESPK